MENFASLMRRAQLFQRLDSDPTKQEWYGGYMRGLRRAHHGEQSGTPAEHEQYMAMSGERQALGDGYRSGFAGVPVPMGEPVTTEERNSATITQK